eukprot:15485690-Alexandrium_andersonii.AAC.1
MASKPWTLHLGRATCALTHPNALRATTPKCSTEQASTPAGGPKRTASPSSELRQSTTPVREA